MRTIEKSNFPEARVASLARRRWLQGWRPYPLVISVLVSAFGLFTSFATVSAAALTVLLLLLFVALAYDGIWFVPASLEAGVAGEAALRRSLLELDDSYTLFTGLIAPGGLEVDAVVVGPTGIVVFEVKSYVGTIIHDADGWRRVVLDGRGHLHSRGIGNPSTQVSRAARAVERYLQGHGVHATVRTALVFSDPQAQLDIEAPNVPVLRLSQVLAFVRTADVLLPATQVAEVVLALDALPGQQPTRE